MRHRPTLPSVWRAHTGSATAWQGRTFSSLTPPQRGFPGHVPGNLPFGAMQPSRACGSCTPSLCPPPTPWTPTFLSICYSGTRFTGPKCVPFLWLPEQSATTGVLKTSFSSVLQGSTETRVSAGCGLVLPAPQHRGAGLRALLGVSAVTACLQSLPLSFPPPPPEDADRVPSGPPVLQMTSS